MKKFVKMSLVAALAVAGTTASATNLEEAIKGVDVSGTMVARINSYEDNTGATGNTDYYKLAVNVSSPVNEDIKANIGLVAGSSTDGGFASLSGNNSGTTTAPTDANASVSLVKANFSYTGIANTTVIAGKQGIATPWSTASDSDGGINTGSGIVALTNVGPVTLAGAIFNNINDKTLGTKGEDLGAVAAMAKVGPVALDAWYASLADTFTTYTIGAKTSFDAGDVKVTVDARHTSLTGETATGSSGATTASFTTTNNDNSLSKIMVSAKMGIFNAYLGYGVSGSEGGTVTLGSATASAKTALIGWSTTLAGKQDADMLMVGAGAQFTPELNGAIKYADVDAKNGTGAADDKEYSETYFEGKWTPSKNFYTYLRAGTYTEETNGVATANDGQRVRVQVQYTF